MNHDVIIVGAGIVGLAFACAIAKSNLRIAVIDKHKPKIYLPTEQYDLRVSAITLGSKKILDKLEVWQHLPTSRIGFFRNMHVWDGSGDGVIDFNSADIDADTLGYIIENRVLQNALVQQLLTYPNIQFIENSIDTIQHTAALLVGADGGESQIRKLAGIELQQRDYHHHALVATVQTTLPHQETAWQRFLPDGILAFLPLAGANQCSIVWSTTPAEVQQLLSMDNNNFKKTLAEKFAYQLGDIIDVSERVTFPLQMRHAKKYVLEKIALIGDAAHTIHPLAGQGVNLGIADAAALAEIILTAQSKKRSIGSLATLRPYERARRSENTIMIATIEAIKQLFSRQELPVQTIRNLGINLTDKITPVKNYLMRRATGC